MYQQKVGTSFYSMEQVLAVRFVSVVDSVLRFLFVG